MENTKKQKRINHININKKEKKAMKEKITKIRETASQEIKNCKTRKRPK